MINLEQLTEEIEEIKLENHGINYLIHAWLEGFRDLMRDARLSKIESDEYLKNEVENAPHFTSLISSSYYIKHEKQILNRELSIRQLPVNRQYHLQFPLMLDKNEYTFILTSCTICKGDDIHELPLIGLRTSMILPEESFEKGITMQDNRINPKRVSKEIISASYKTVHNFIERCRF